MSLKTRVFTIAVLASMPLGFARANCASAQQQAQRCMQEGQQTMQTCDANQDPEIQQANQRGEQLNAQLGVSQNIQKACSETKDFNNQFNQAMQSFKNKCDQAQQRCNSTCDQAQQAASSCPPVMGMVQQGKQQCQEAQARVEKTTGQQREAQNNKQEANICQDNSQGGQGGGGPLAQTPDSLHMVSDCSDPAKAQSEPTCVCRYIGGSGGVQCQKRENPVAVTAPSAGGSFVGEDGITYDRPRGGSTDAMGPPNVGLTDPASASGLGLDGNGGSVARAAAGDAGAFDSSSSTSLASTPGQISALAHDGHTANLGKDGVTGANGPKAGFPGSLGSSEDEEDPALAPTRRPAAATDAAPSETEEKVAMHGPNANMFEEVHGRYNKLLETLISD